MATANDFAVANSYLPPKKPVLGQNELAVWVMALTLASKVQGLALRVEALAHNYITVSVHHYRKTVNVILMNLS